MQMNEINKSKSKSLEPLIEEDRREFAKSDVLTGKIQE